MKAQWSGVAGALRVSIAERAMAAVKQSARRVQVVEPRDKVKTGNLAAHGLRRLRR